MSNRPGYWKAYYKRKMQDPAWRAKRVANARKWALAHPEETRARARRTYHRNKAKYAARKRARMKDPRYRAHQREVYRAWYARNRKRIIAQIRKRRKDPARLRAHRAWTRAYQKRKYYNDPAWHARYRANQKRSYLKHRAKRLKAMKAWAKRNRR